MSYTDGLCAPLDLIMTLNGEIKVTSPLSGQRIKPCNAMHYLLHAKRRSYIYTGFQLAL